MGHAPFYADTDEAISRVVTALDRAAARGEVAGLDTEFYGVDLRVKSTVAESRLHLLSIAVIRHPVKIQPRGFSVSDAAVLPRAAIDHRGFRRWLESESLKAVHNLPVDAHTLGNEGVKLGGGINTLARARWAWPERARAEGFTLDALGRDLCGSGKTEGYKEIFTRQVQVPVEKVKKLKVCECGEHPGKGHPRASVPGHSRLVLEHKSIEYRTAMEEVPLAEVIPGHPLWGRCLEYAARDAVLALAVWELSERAMNVERVVPWLV